MVKDFISLSLYNKFPLKEEDDAFYIIVNATSLIQILCIKKHSSI